MLTLLEIISTQLSELSDRTKDYIISFRDIASKYKAPEHRKPFNIILSTSDFYYRENFHSDILAAILEKDKKYLFLFIDFINKHSEKQISATNYEKTQVLREDNKIDILVYDLSSNHCIIIENKINNAGDMKRQIPRYVLLQKEKQRTVDAIVYFSLDGGKRPDTSTWTKCDKEKMQHENIIYCGAVNDTSDCFLNFFLSNCLLSTTSSEEYTFFRQYADLLQYIWRNQMDMNVMEEFYQTICKDNNYKTAQSIHSMIDDLVKFRRDRIYNKYVNNHTPFENISTYSSNNTHFHKISPLTNENIKFDIDSFERSTVIRFWLQNPICKEDYILNVLEVIGKDKDFAKESDNKYIKKFNFPEEDSRLYEYINEFCSSLNKNLETLKNLNSVI